MRLAVAYNAIMRYRPQPMVLCYYEKDASKRKCYYEKDVAYNLRTQKLLQLPSTNTLSYGNDSLSFRGAILWNTLSDSIKSLATSASFKRSIKEWKGDNCSCKICRYRVRGNFTRSVFVHNYF